MNHQKFLKYSTPIFILLGLILLFGPRSWFPEFYHPVFMGSMFLLSPLVAYCSIFFFRYISVKEEKVALKIRSAVLFSLALNNAGELGLFQLYRLGFEYDKFAHFLVSFLFAFLLGEYFLLKKHSSINKVLVVVFLTVFSAGIVWEILEATSDVLFRTKLWGIYGEYVTSDTLRDLFFNSLGIILGIYTLYVRKVQKLDKSFFIPVPFSKRLPLDKIQK